jgi:hypothetical protein
MGIHLPVQFSKDRIIRLREFGRQIGFGEEEEEIFGPKKIKSRANDHHFENGCRQNRQNFNVPSFQ